MTEEVLSNRTRLFFVIMEVNYIPVRADRKPGCENHEEL